MKYEHFVQDLPYIIPTFIVPPSFRGEDFLNFSQSETRIAHGDHDFCPIEMK
jgi:hypothetical protein